MVLFLLNATSMRRLLLMLTLFFWSAQSEDGGHGQCSLHEILPQLESQCTSTSPSYETILSSYSAQCCNCKPLRVLAPLSFKSWIQAQAGIFQNETGMPVDVTFAAASSIPTLISSQLGAWAQQDLWIIDGASLPTLAYQNALLNLEGLVQMSPSLNWSNVQPLWAALSVINSKAVAVPIGSDALLMYYRKDVLEASNRTLPTTWEELTNLARAWNARAANAPGTDTLGAGESTAPPQPKYGICLSNATGCTSAHLLSAILASMTQQLGPRQGWALALEQPDPIKAAQLINGTAMYEALRIYHSLAAQSPAGLSCTQALSYFVAGDCLVTINLGSQFKALGQGQGQKQGALVRGAVGVALPPGSTQVYDRGREELVAAGWGSCRQATRAAAAARNGAWVCRAPLLAYGGTFGVVGLRNSTFYQQLAFQFLQQLVSEPAQLAGLLDASSAAAPVLSSLMQPGAVQYLTDVYDGSDAEQYLAALREAFGAHNVALEFGASAAFSLRADMEAAIQAYGEGTAAPQVADGMLRAWLQVWAALGFNISQVQQVLLPATPDPFREQREGPVKHGRVVGWALALGLVIGSMLLAAAVSMLCLCIRIRLRPGTIRRILPPRLLPETTLVVTDIQDSTKMWEVLSSDVMDIAIYHHHSLARRLCFKFRGYESATEGDSFIIAFQGADDAVCFCALFQQELMLLPWPEDLLALEGCGAVWMCRTESAVRKRRASQLHIPPDVSKSPAAMLVIGDNCSGAPSSYPDGGNRSVAAAPTVQLSSTDQRSAGSIPGGAAASAGTAGTAAGMESASAGAGSGIRPVLSQLTREVMGARGAGAVGLGAASVDVVGGGVGGGGGGSRVGAAADPDLKSLPTAAPAPAVMPRFGRITVPYTLAVHASASPSAALVTGLYSSPSVMANLGALGASPRQLSLLGRSVSRLGAIASTAVTSTAPSPVVGHVGGRSFERPSLRHLPTAPTAGNLGGGHDLLHPVPVTPVGSQSGGGDAGAAAAAAAKAARPAISQDGGVMSFRENFRDDAADAAADAAIAAGAATKSARVAPSPGERPDCGGTPTRSGYQNAVIELPRHSSSRIRRGSWTGSWPPVARSLTGTSSAVGGGSEGSEHDRGLAERAMNNSRHWRSTEIATVWEFNVQYESGSQASLRSAVEGGPISGPLLGLGRVQGAPAALQVPTVTPAPPSSMLPLSTPSVAAAAAAAAVTSTLQGSQAELVGLLPSPHADAVSTSVSGAMAASGVRAAHVAVENGVAAPAATAAALAAPGGAGPLGESSSSSSVGGGGVQTPVAATLQAASHPAMLCQASVFAPYDVHPHGPRGAEDDSTVGGSGSSSAATATTPLLSCPRPNVPSVSSPQLGDGVQPAATATTPLLSCPRPNVPSVSSPQVGDGVQSAVVTNRNRSPDTSPSRGTPSTSPPSSNISSRPSLVAYRRTASQLRRAVTGGGGGGAAFAASLRRRSDISVASGFAGGGGDAAAMYGVLPYGNSLASSTHGHGHGHDGALGPSPLGRGFSHLSGFSGLRGPPSKSQAGSEATGRRSSNSRSLHCGPSTNGSSTEAEQRPTQSSPLPRGHFAVGALLEVEENGDGDGGGGAAAAAATKPIAIGPTVRAESGAPNPDPRIRIPESGPTVRAESGAPRAGHDGGVLGGSSLGAATTPSRTLAHAPPLPSLRSNTIPAAAASASHIATPTATIRSAACFSNGNTRGLVGLVSLPSTPPTGELPLGMSMDVGAGSPQLSAPLPSVASRAGSMVSMMRMASQHNLQSVGDSLCSRWQVADKGERGAQLVFRGLRVRMGVHSGLSPSSDSAEVNRATNRMQYTGLGLQTAKAVSDCAHGGQVLLSEAALRQLAVESLTERVMILHMGEHRTKDELPSTGLYWGCPRALQGRLPSLRVIRSRQQYSLGVLDAPAGLVVVVFMHVVGAMSLLDWNADLASTALAMFRDHVTLELINYQGYLVEAVDGLVLASFSAPSAALRWIAKCQSDMKMLPWPQELLCHEACEELSVMRPHPITGLQEEVVVLRGLRLKAGVDMGRLRGEINCVTGRMSYRGRAMNRAARIVAAAGSDQILASAEVWTASNTQAAVPTCGLTGVRMGQFSLKGVSEGIEIYLIKTAGGVMSRRARTMLASREDPLELDELPIADPVAAMQHRAAVTNSGELPGAAAAAAAAAAAVAASGVSVSGPRALTGSAGGLGSGAGGVPAKLMIERMKSTTSGLAAASAAALRRDESLTWRLSASRQVSRNASIRSRRSSRRSSMGSQYSTLAASTMVAMARGSFDDRQDILLPSSSRAGTAAAAAVAAGAGAAGGAAAANPSPFTPALQSGGTGVRGGGFVACGTGGGGGTSQRIALPCGQRSVSQPQLQQVPLASTVAQPSQHRLLHRQTSASGVISIAVSMASHGGGVPHVPYGLPSIGSGTRTSRNSATDHVDTDGVRSSHARSSNGSNRSAHPAARTTPIHASATSGAAGASAGANAAVNGTAGGIESPVAQRSGPAGSLIRHLSTLVRSATLAFYGGSSGNTAGAQFSSVASSAVGPSSLNTVGIGLATAVEPPGSVGCDNLSSGRAEHPSRPSDRSMATTTRLPGADRAVPALHGSQVAAGAGAAGAGGGGSGGGGGGGDGGSGTGRRDMLPPRLRAARSLFHVGSFSGPALRRRPDEPIRTTEDGEASPAGFLRSSITRRQASTITGMSHVVSVGAAAAGGASANSLPQVNASRGGGGGGVMGMLARRFGTNEHPSERVLASLLGTARSMHREPPSTALERGDVGGDAFVIVVGDDDPEVDSDESAGDLNLMTEAVAAEMGRNTELVPRLRIGTEVMSPAAAASPQLATQQLPSPSPAPSHYARGSEGSGGSSFWHGGTAAGFWSTAGATLNIGGAALLDGGGGLSSGAGWGSSAGRRVPSTGAVSAMPALPGFVRPSTGAGGDGDCGNTAGRGGGGGGVEGGTDT